MGIVRWLLVLAVVLLIVRVAWRLLQSSPDPTTDDDPAAQTAQAESLLRCRGCRTLIPRDAALLHDGEPYCGPACRPS